MIQPVRCAARRGAVTAVLAASFAVLATGGALAGEANMAKQVEGKL